MTSLLVTLLLPTALVVFAYAAHFLTLDGCVAAFFIGAVCIDAGLTASLQLLAFFFLGSFLTKYRQKEKERLMPYRETKADDAKEQQQPAAAADGSSKRKKKKGRDSRQVLATGLIPALFCLLRYVPLSLLPAFPLLAPLRLAVLHHRLLFSSFMAVNLADTLASELGMLSPHPPLLISNWRANVATGVDGGVSLLGTLASIAGGAIIGLCSGSLHSTAAMALVGMNGSVIDSLLGIALQSRPQPAADGSSAHWKPRSMSAAAWASSNALVNLLSCLLTSLLHLAAVWAWETHGLSCLPSVLLFDGLLLLNLCRGWLNDLMLDNVSLLTVVAASLLCYRQQLQVIAWYAVVLLLWTVRPYYLRFTQPAASAHTTISMRMKHL